MFVRLLSTFISRLCGWIALTAIASANPVFFAKGDASFVGVVDRTSDFMKGGSVINAATFLSSVQYLDYTKGNQLDVSKCPASQLLEVRKQIERVLDSSNRPNDCVLVCVTDVQFNFEATWLGIPYNHQSHTLSDLSVGDWRLNILGPSGEASLSCRDCWTVPPLKVDQVNDDRFLLVGECSFCILTMDNAVLQKGRHVITGDGAYRLAEFRYDPQERVGFEEGDAFFVARAERFRKPQSETVQLSYLDSPRWSYDYGSCPNGGDIPQWSPEMETATKEIQIRAKGNRMIVKGVPASIGELLEPSDHRVWYVFVVGLEYDPGTYGLGHRYNRNPIGIEARPVPFEFVNCTYSHQSYPAFNTASHQHPGWPPSLPVSWDGDVMSVEMSHVQLIFVQYWDFPRFEESNLRDAFMFRIVRNRVQTWFRGQMQSESKLGD